MSDAEDAARYRWLRDRSLGQWMHPIVVTQERTMFGMRYIGPLCGKNLDREVDAAIAAWVPDVNLMEENSAKQYESDPGAL